VKKREWRKPLRFMCFPSLSFSLSLFQSLSLIISFTHTLSLSLTHTQITQLSARPHLSTDDGDLRQFEALLLANGVKDLLQAVHRLNQLIHGCVREPQRKRDGSGGGGGEGKSWREIRVTSTRDCDRWA
jgi:hypothetical protein